VDEDSLLRLVAWVVTCNVLVGWTALVALALYLMHRRIAALERARPGSAGMFGQVVPLGYALILPVWFVALPLGCYWLWRKPELARQGRISVLATLAFATAALLFFGAAIFDPLP